MTIQLSNLGQVYLICGKTDMRQTVVDHMVPHGGDQDLFWNQSNWQPLCKSCHDRKTQTVDRDIEYGYRFKKKPPIGD